MATKRNPDDRKLEDVRKMSKKQAPARRIPTGLSGPCSSQVHNFLNRMNAAERAMIISLPGAVDEQRHRPHDESSVFLEWVKSHSLLMTLPPIA